MIGRTNTGGGGGGLAFKVIPNPQPSTAKENTIWVNTNKINNYYFSATQPDHMEDYDVWFLVGTTSSVEFNALKKHCIQVYPMSAKQYVSGVLMDVTAESYQGGEWVDWFDGYLFNNGKTPNIVTGWRVYSNGVVSIGSFTNGSMSVGNTITAMAKEYAYVNFYPSPPIDLTPYSKFVVDVVVDQESESSYPNYICISKDGSHTVHATKTISGKNRQTVELDISGIDGAFYCGVRITSWRGATTNATVYSMRLV